MAGPEGIAWRRAFPSRAVRVLVWYVAIACVVVGLVWLLFGDEPARLDDGRVNPLVLVLPLAVLFVLGGAVPVVLNVARRPLVSANHYALTVRPGSARTLVLPWARVARVTVRRIGRETYLLVRCRRPMDALGDRPTWVDRGVLHSALRTPTARASEYDLAVRVRDFLGEPNAQLATLAAFAPDHVAISVEV